MSPAIRMWVTSPMPTAEVQVPVQAAVQVTVTDSFFFGQANTTRPNGEMCAVNARNMMINGRQLAVTFVQLLLSEKEFWGGARGQFPNGSTDTSSRYNIYRLFKGKRPMTATYIDKKMSIICIESIILILTATYIDKKSILCIESKI